MLSQLFIENIAVVEKTSIDFHHGLNVLTGETGAGKSIIIDAIHAVLGQRTSRDLIRTGTEKATVSAVFTGLSRHTVAEMESFGFDPEEDGTLVLQREITSAGKSVCRVNGRPAPVSVLRELGARLIQIHGQNENLDLLVPGVSLGYLDRLGNLQELVGRYRDAYNAMRKVQQALDSLQMDEAEKARRLDLLRFQIGELEQADIQLGEIEELKTKKQLYMNSERVARALLQAKAAMDGDEETAGSLQLLRLASDAAEEAGRYLPQAKELATRIQSAQYELEDCLEELRELDEQVEYDPADVEDVELRLDLLHRLSRKYGPDEEEILRYLNQAKKELESIEFSEERSRALEKEYRSLRKNAQALAEQLSSSRLAAARSFEKAVKIQLQFLDMPGVRLQVDLEKGTLGESGQDEARFLISTNPGEPPKPIAKIASGGELSRIMLAIKTVLAAHDEVTL
jgi:DNA repair protein RecN (Recombination protein N)